MTDGVIETSDFKWRVHPIKGVIKPHTGIDIVFTDGQVKAQIDGRVSMMKDLEGYGQTIVIDNGTMGNAPDAERITTLYGHNAEKPDPETGDMVIDSNLKVGDYVKRGDVIGIQGSTGASTGDHSHFEIRINNVPVDPKIMPSAETLSDMAK